MLPAPASVHGSRASPHTNAGPDIYHRSGSGPGHLRKLQHHRELLEASETVPPCGYLMAPVCAHSQTLIHIPRSPLCVHTHAHAYVYIRMCMHASGSLSSAIQPFPLSCISIFKWGSLLSCPVSQNSVRQVFHQETGEEKACAVFVVFLFFLVPFFHRRDRAEAIFRIYSP